MRQVCSIPDRLDLMVEALDLLGRLSEQQLVFTTALMQAMLPTQRCWSSQEGRIQAHVQKLGPENRDWVTSGDWERAEDDMGSCARRPDGAGSGYQELRHGAGKEAGSKSFGAEWQAWRWPRQL